MGGVSTAFLCAYQLMSEVVSFATSGCSSLPNKKMSLPPLHHLDTDATSERNQLTDDCLNRHVLRQANRPGAQAPNQPFYYLGKVEPPSPHTYSLQYQLPPVSASAVVCTCMATLGVRCLPAAVA